MAYTTSWQDLNDVYRQSRLPDLVKALAGDGLLHPQSDTAGYLPSTTKVVWLSPTTYGSNKFGSVLVRFPSTLFGQPASFWKYQADRKDRDPVYLNSQINSSSKVTSMDDLLRPTAAGWTYLEGGGFIRMATQHHVDLDEAISFVCGGGPEATPWLSTSAMVALAAGRRDTNLARRIVHNDFFQLVPAVLEKSTGGVSSSQSKAKDQLLAFGRRPPGEARANYAISDTARDRIVDHLCDLVGGVWSPVDFKADDEVDLQL